MNGLKSQFWGKLETSPETRTRCEQALVRLSKRVDLTKSTLGDRDRQMIIGEAKEVIGWKLVLDPIYSYKFIGYLEGKGGLHSFHPKFLFIHDNAIYGYDTFCYSSNAYKFSNDLNFENLLAMVNVLQEEPAISKSCEVKDFIQDIQEGH